jgi:exopolysaccharide biosynthesis polyprenyl glycosylphosphotransferase
MTETARLTGAGTLGARPTSRRPALRRAASDRRWRRVLPLGAAAGDVAAVALGTTAAVRLRYGGSVPQLGLGDDRSVGYLVAGAAIAATWPAVVAAHGGYRTSVVGSGPPELVRVLRAALALLAALAVAHLVLGTDVSARLVVLVVTLTVLCTLASRLVVGRVVARARARHRWVQRAVLLGPSPDTRALADHLRSMPALGLEVVGACPTDGHRNGRGNGNGSRSRNANGNGNGNGNGHGGSTGVLGMVAAAGADVLAVTGATSAEHLRALAWELEPAGIDLLVAPVVGLTAPRVAVEPLAGTPVLRVEPCRLTAWRLVAKNVVDRAGAALLLVVLAPVLVACALAIRLTRSGPALYRQPRVGRHGTTFELLKFRTMVAGAEARLAELAHRNESDGLLFKIRDDPRITPVGRLLRRTSLDELPQLWNVLRGDMSLVGPRPLPVPAAAFVGSARRRLRVKPGLTGLSQVSGRSELSWDETVRIDAHYVDNWSLGLDLLVLLRTPLAIVKGTGAY